VGSHTRRQPLRHRHEQLGEQPLPHGASHGDSQERIPGDLVAWCITINAVRLHVRVTSCTITNPYPSFQGVLLGQTSSYLDTYRKDGLLTRWFVGAVSILNLCAISLSDTGIC
jgi:hypothetical protein